MSNLIEILVDLIFIRKNCLSISIVLSHHYIAEFFPPHIPPFKKKKRVVIAIIVKKEYPFIRDT